MQQPWQKDVEEIVARQLDDLRSWRALVLPLSAFANFLFFVALQRTGAGTMTTAVSFIAASTLTLWTVSVQARIDALSAG